MQYTGYLSQSIFQFTIIYPSLSFDMLDCIPKILLESLIVWAFTAMILYRESICLCVCINLYNFVRKRIDQNIRFIIDSITQNNASSNHKSRRNIPGRFTCSFTRDNIGSLFKTVTASEWLSGLLVCLSCGRMWIHAPSVYTRTERVIKTLDVILVLIFYLNIACRTFKCIALDYSNI